MEISPAHSLFFFYVQKDSLFSHRNNVFLTDYEKVERLSMLSDNAELKDLKERIIYVARNERNGLLIIFMGVFLAGSGLIFSVTGSSGPAYFGGIFVSALGIFSTLFGFCVAVHYAHQYNDLLNKLDRT